MRLAEIIIYQRIPVCQETDQGRFISVFWSGNRPGKRGKLKPCNLARVSMT